MHLQNASKEILQQLVALTVQLSAYEYAQPLSVLSGNSVGKHVRHVIEFYDLLLKSYTTGELNYDQRKHDHTLEESPILAAERIKLLIGLLATLEPDRPLYLEACLSTEADETVRIPSTFCRELLYNIEHAIHHMAIIRIAVKETFPTVVLPAQFGVAYSTVKQFSLST